MRLLVTLALRSVSTIQPIALYDPIQGLLSYHGVGRAGRSQDNITVLGCNLNSLQIGGQIRFVRHRNRICFAAVSS